MHLAMNKLNQKRIGLFLLSLIGTFFVITSAKSQTVDNLKDQKNLVQQKLTEINKQIQGLQKQIQATRSQQASLKNEISIYDNQIRSTQLAIDAKNTQIEDTNLQIKILLEEIDKRTKEIEDNKKILADFLRQLQQLDNNYVLNVSFGSDQFSEFLDQVQYNQNIQAKVHSIIQNIKEIREKLKIQEKELEAKRAELQSLKEQLEETKGSLVTQRAGKEQLLSRTKGLERNYQTLYSASSKEAADLQKEADELDKSIAEKLGKRTISPGKGSLAKPMDGIMTQGYGNTGFRALGYSFHNGIDIAAPAGEPVYAAGDGVVVASDTGEASYGNWIAIKHSIVTKNGPRDIISLYGHLRSIKVKIGQTVEQGTLIGYEGNTGNTTRLLYGPERGYHLHFTIFDAEGFGVSQGKYTKIYGPYTVPYGYTYNPLDFLQ